MFQQVCPDFTESADFHNLATRITDLVFGESYAFEYPVLAKFLGSQSTEYVSLLFN